MREKPTVNDIARVAGVSLATVDRVLNARPGVRQVTVEKVKKAIKDLGYVRDLAAGNLARKRVYHFTFVLPEVENDFVRLLVAQIRTQGLKLAQERTILHVTNTSRFDPLNIINVLDGIEVEKTDGIALFAPETPGVRDAVRRLRDRGIAVVAFVSDLPSSVRNHFVGIDNVAAGRTAAQLMGRFTNCEGQILVLTGSRLDRDHLERRLGFDQVMQTSFPALNVLPSFEGRDDTGLICELLKGAFKAYKDICGIYCSASGNQGLIEHLKTIPLAIKPVVIAHELTYITRKALMAGTFDALISQDTGHLVRSAVRLLRASVDHSPYNSAQERIRIEIHLKENLPAL